MQSQGTLLILYGKALDLLKKFAEAILFRCHCNTKLLEIRFVILLVHPHTFIQFFIVWYHRLLKLGKVLITTSWDDGHPLDLKLCSLLRDYRKSATMYIPIANPEREVISSDTIRAIAKDFEIGAHTYNHTWLTQVDEKRMTYELTESKNVLESIVQKEVISFCYPRGLYNKKVIEKVKECGYKLARTGKSLCTIIRPLEYHPTIHVFDYNLVAKGKHIVTAGDRSLATKLLLYGNIFRRWDMIAKKSLDHVLENGGIWHLWGHSWEIDHYENWPLLRDVLEYAKVNGRKYGAEFVTNGMLVGY